MRRSQVEPFYLRLPSEIYVHTFNSSETFPVLLFSVAHSLAHFAHFHPPLPGRPGSHAPRRFAPLRVRRHLGRKITESAVKNKR